jgi:hypothetical protein
VTPSAHINAALGFTLITPPALAWSTVGAGIILSACVGYGCRRQKGWVFVFISAILAGCLAIPLSIMNGFLYSFCVDTIKICERTSDITVWSLSYPLLAAPLYWVAMVLFSVIDGNTTKPEGGSDSSD